MDGPIEPGHDRICAMLRTFQMSSPGLDRAIHDRGAHRCVDGPVKSGHDKIGAPNRVRLKGAR
jgi:hypothetical protein